MPIVTAIMSLDSVPWSSAPSPWQSRAFTPARASSYRDPPEAPARRRLSRIVVLLGVDVGRDSGGIRPATRGDPQCGSGGRESSCQPSTVRLAVVVVNYASAKLLQRNLVVVAREARAIDPDATVIVVDNWSTADERRAAEEVARANEWTLIAPESNTGFGGGVNIGVTRALADGATTSSSSTRMRTSTASRCACWNPPLRLPAPRSPRRSSPTRTGVRGSRYRSPARRRNDARATQTRGGRPAAVRTLAERRMPVDHARGLGARGRIRRRLLPVLGGCRLLCGRSCRPADRWRSSRTRVRSTTRAARSAPTPGSRERNRRPTTTTTSETDALRGASPRRGGRAALAPLDPEDSFAR